MSAEVLHDASSPINTTGPVVADQHDASAIAAARLCAWCDASIPARARRDAICCSTRCRQARHRFTTSVGRSTRYSSRGSALRLAYADPPYPGLSERYYAQHPDFAGEVDHGELIRRLSTYDGWALSTSARSLQLVLASCPPGVRIAAWVRGERPTRSYWPLNAWEPVIYFGGRQDCTVSDLSWTAGETRRVDTLVHHSRPRLSDPRRVIGAKPATFAGWLFELLGAAPCDSFDDLFPGSHGITRAWASYTREASA